MFIEEIVVFIVFQNYVLYPSYLICIHVHLTRYKLSHNRYVRLITDKLMGKSTNQTLTPDV